MRRRGAWGLPIVLLLAAGAPGPAPPDDPIDQSAAKPGSGNWLTRWFAPAPKPPEKKLLPKDGQAPDKLDMPKKARSVLEEASAVRAREEAKYLRRSKVCDKLREIAEAADDPALARRADQLEERAWAVYQQRTHDLALGRAPAPELDRQVLEKHLGGSPPAAPARPETDLITVPGRPGGSCKEDKE